MNFKQTVTRQQFVTRQDCRFTEKHIVGLIIKISQEHMQ